MYYTIEFVGDLREKSEYSSVEEAINTEFLVAMKEEKWLYKQESAVVERLNYILGQGSKLKASSNSVTIKHAMFGERVIAKQLPGVPQGGLTGEYLLEKMKEEGSIRIKLSEFYDERQFRLGVPAYLGKISLHLKAERVSRYSESERAALYLLTEEEARQKPGIDKIFSEGPQNIQESMIVDHFYLRRPPLKGIESDITRNHIKVSSEHTIYVHLQRYKRVDRYELEKKLTEVVRLGKEMGVKVTNSEEQTREIEQLWSIYESEMSSSDEIYKTLVTRWANLAEIRQLREGTRDDLFLERTMQMVREYKSYGGRGKAIDRIREINGRVTRAYEKLKEQERGETGSRLERINL